MTDRNAFDTATEITFQNADGKFVTEKVVSRVRPGAWGVRALRTSSGAKVSWIDVLAYSL